MLFESANVRVETDDQIATLWLDSAGRTENRITLQLLDDLTAASQAVQRSTCLDLLVIRSSKVGGFSPGYCLEELSALRGEEEYVGFASRGQQALQQLANLSASLTTVALIEGECRSAGLELALACDYRFAVSRPDTCFSFPEIADGLVPCWGGTQRLPKLLGLRLGLEMLLRGQEASCWQALAWGLVDRASEEKHARIEFQAFLDRLQDKPRKPAAPRRLSQRWRDSLPIARWWLWQSYSRQMADLDPNEFTAPRAALRAVALGYSSPAEAFVAERTAFAEAAATVAFRNALDSRRRAAVPPRLRPEPLNPTPAAPERIGIVGGGEMGARLASWFALNGREVVLQEYSEETLGLAGARLEEAFNASLSAGVVGPAEIERARKNVRRTAGWNGFDRAQIIIEAADEDLGVKRGIFSELESRARPRTILATTSSTLRVEAIQAELNRPGRVVGLHFLDGELNNPLVEIVRSPLTDTQTLATLDAWIRSWRKIPLIVGDRPGRMVLRVQLAYLSEAVLLVMEGLPPEAIDREMRRFGMKFGPLETIDKIGFERLARLVEDMQVARGDAIFANLLLERMRAYGWNGCENGEGFYRYSRGRARTNSLARMVLWHEAGEDVVSHYIFDPRESLELGVDRLILRTINEAAALIVEEPDADPGLIDMGLSIGMAWPLGRGGPLRHADQIGLVALVERLTEFTERFGKRFEPCVELQQRAEAGEAFYETSVGVEMERPESRRRLAG